MYRIARYVYNAEQEDTMLYTAEKIPPGREIEDEHHQYQHVST
jgi:hypothetical protein